METFLERASRDIIKNHGSNLSRTAVVFPNKRASLFMNDAIARNSDKPVWSPAYITISELFRRQTKMQTADEIYLVCKLYEIYKKETDSTESIDKFYDWGRIMLSDFDDLDKNMGDAEQIFKNLQDLSKLENADYLTDEQKEIIKQFYKDFCGDSELKERFRNLWDKLGDIYKAFKEELRKEGKTYEGALYREVAEKGNIELEYDKYIFTGFNMLQKAEQKLFELVNKEGKAEFYWDYDTSFIEDKDNEAGHFIREYIEKFPNMLEKEDEVYKGLSTEEKQINYISSSTNDLQARLANEWLKDEKNGGRRAKEGKKTAVVLCDENLLQTVMNSIPEEAKTLNVTMGYPLSKTPAASLIMKLIESQTKDSKRSDGKIYIKNIEGLINHPFAKYLGLKKSFYKLVKDKEYNVTLEEIGLPSISSKDIKGINNWVAKAIEQVARNYNKENEGKSSEKQLAIESLFKAYTLINRLSSLMEGNILKVEEATYIKLVKQLINSTSITFHGEPAKGVQIMGLLETRNLDFENILVLSANEGNMPKGVNDTSFIPYSIRKAFGLTTIDNKVAIYAYYFYNLLQRAKDISITYSTVSDNGQKGEMSRFMQQLAVEKTANIKIENYNLQSGIEVKTPSEVKEIEKTDKIFERLRDAFNERLVSPSAINLYVNCPLSFFYKYVAGLDNNEERELGEISPLEYGSIFHEVMEAIYKDHKNVKITEAYLEGKKKDLDDLIETAYKKVVWKEATDIPELSGVQKMQLNSIKEYLKKMIDIDIDTVKNCDEFKVLMTEEEHSREYPIDSTLKFKLGGIIDRLDSITTKDGKTTIRVFDYKTGKKHNPLKLLGNMFDDSDADGKGYYLQTFLYASVVKEMKEYKDKNVAPALCYIKEAKKENYDPVLVLKDKNKAEERINDIGTYKEEYDEKLKERINEIFDKETPFTAAKNDNACKYCTYKNLCNHKCAAKDDDTSESGSDD